MAHVSAERQCLPWAHTVDFSQAVVTDAELVFTAGQGPFDADGAIVGLGDPEAQMRQTFTNLRAVLESVGASLETVVSQTVYLARAEDFPVFKGVRREFFSTPFPAATTLRVDLLEPGMLVELTAVAAIGVPRAQRGGTAAS
jgi:enamine deaminase RidA (YjgF/YER057c/UK114 family)